MQDQLESIWTSLQMPDSLKLDMALKYGTDEYHPLLAEVPNCWSRDITTGLNFFTVGFLNQ